MIHSIIGKLTLSLELSNSQPSPQDARKLWEVSEELVGLGKTKKTK